MIDANSFDKKQTYRFDVCIIGGGVAGTIIARELINTGLTVGLFDAGEKNFTAESQKFYAPEEKPTHYEDTSYNRLRFLGGSSNHWENGVSPLNPHDFKTWPISYNDVAPYYPEAGEYCSVGNKDYSLETWLSTLQGDDSLKPSEAVKLSIAKGAKIPTRFYAKYGGDLEAAQNITVMGNANLIDVDFDGEKITKAYFKNYGSVEVVVEASTFVMCMGGIENARYMLMFNEKYDNRIGNQGGNVGRYFMDHPVIPAARFYPTEKFNRNLVQSVMLDDVGHSVVAFMELTEKALETNNLINIRMPLMASSKFSLATGTDSMHVIGRAISDLEIPDDMGKHLGNIFSDFDMVLEGISRKLFDEKLFDDAAEKVGYNIWAMVNQSPEKTNRVVLGTERDDLGLKKHKIEWSLSEKDRNNVWDSLKLAALELSKLGLGKMRVMEEFQSRIFSEQVFFAHHHIGTTRMAQSHDQGVVDTNCRVFGTSNLFVAGSSIFTSGGHVPPTLTIAAFALRLVEHIKDQYHV
ncbi:GMC family oxidoreductase [Alteromonas sp. S005]|uniref:GMC family oxidoreductase n=1 Tax=Alteromonas sp. S005 TaxID=3117400 RepID=UPI002FE1568A